MTTRPRFSNDQTAREMTRMVVQYSGDLGDKAKWSLPRFYDYVRKLPYHPDPRNDERVSRPRFTLRPDWPDSRDCDDKSVLIGSWCFQNKIPFRFVCSSSRPDRHPHHVFVLGRFRNREHVIDATYPHNRLGEWPNNLTLVQPLTGNIMQTLTTLEGDGLGISVKKIGRAAKRTAKKAVRAATNPKNIVKAATFTARPSSLKKIARAAKNIVSTSMPASLKRSVKKAVLSVIGNRTVTPQLKAVVLPTVTAAALAIPGVSPLFTAAVPIVVNQALDEIISEAKKKASSSSSATVQKAASAIRMKQRTTLAPVQAAIEKAKAKAESQVEEQKADNAASTSSKKKWIIGGAALTGIGLAAYLGLRK